MIRRWPTPGMVPVSANSTSSLSSIDQLDGPIAAWADKPGGMLLVTAGPQSGKTTKFCYQTVPWLLVDEPDLRVCVATYSMKWAKQLGRNIRRYCLQVGVSVDRERLATVAVGSPVPHPQGLLIVDDPLRTYGEAQNPMVRGRVWLWWRHEALPSLAPGGRAAVVQAHWHEDDLAGRLLATEPDRWDHHDLA